MGYDEKTREQLIYELIELRRQVDELKERMNSSSKELLIHMKNEEERRNLEICNIEQDRLCTEIAVQREWFHVTLSSIGDAVIATDTNCNVAFMNQVAENLTGFTLKEAIGKSISEVFRIFNENTLEPAEIPVFRVIEEGFVIGLANHTGLISKSGQKYSIADSAAPIKNKHGDIIGVVMVFRDITETKMLEEEITRLDKLKLLGQMAAGIAHEIRNPMTTVRGFLQLLSINKECSKYREYFSTMIDELDRANSIIKNYLGLAKTNSHIVEKISLNSVINDISPIIQADAVLFNKFVKIDLGDIPDLKLADGDIRQIIFNLTRNGLDAMPTQGVLTIKTYTEGDFVILSVKDQGKGISPDIIDKISLPFFTTKENGTGLGLSICNSIAEQYGATIDVETGDHGTTFFVRFRQNGN